MKVKMTLMVAAAFVLLMIFPIAASAHVLDGVYGVVAQLGHQLLGWHHLPLTILLVVIGVALFIGLRRSGFSRDR